MAFTSGRKLEPKGKIKQAYAVDMASGDEMVMAGLWSKWRDPASREEVLSCTVLTCAPNDAMAEIHNRMPVILDEKDWPKWLGEEAATEQDLLALLRTRTMWGMMLGFGGINYTAWLYLTWLPGYLASEYHLKLGATGMISGIPFAAGAVGMVASGVLTDLKVRDRLQAMRYRRYLIVIGMLLSAGCTALVVRATSLTMAVAGISMAVMFIHFAGTAAWNLIHVSSSARLSPQVGALQSMGSYAIASAGPIITGWLLDRTHSFHIALLICSGVTAAGAMAYLTMTLKPIVIGRVEERSAVV